MPKTSVEKLIDLGQSIWLDNISRSMIETGRLKGMISAGIRGMTSNPTIFDKSIRLSSNYDKSIEELGASGKSTFDIYDELTVKDVQDAADIFKDVYENTNGLDGYVSLEVDPRLAFKTTETIDEAMRLFKKVERPNVMFKIPATNEGFVAIEELISRGININATLIFSVEQYIKTASSYIKGLERFSQSSQDLNKIRSVASVFVSRVDTTVDNIIDEKALPDSLKGKAACANSKLIYTNFFDIFSRDNFKRLSEKGANLQRVLWASTGTKNHLYSDVKYVEDLIGKDTVNTLPENTFQAFLDHGIAQESLGPDEREAQATINSLGYFGIDIDNVCKTLLQEGVVAFEKSFNFLLSSIENKKGALCKGP